jgi:UDP-N-acetylglucosamine--N-acetylmuramyl-(pentapeptide) pyrophosphoryl-undecaprenol N-acetylglucosamine transferase
MRVLVSGGGTAGHVYPALAVANALAASGGDEVAFVGAPGSLEERLAAAARVRFIPVRASGWDRARPLTLVVGAFSTFVSLFRCLGVIRHERADAVLGFGGYVPLSIGLAAVFSGVPLVLHEQNTVPGVANRVLARWADAVCATYEVSAQGLRHPERVVVTGDPVRESVSDADRDKGRAAFGVTPGETLLLVFGGSRGARHLNQAVIGLYRTLSVMPDVRVVQIAGPLEAATVRADLADGAGGEPPTWWTVEEYVDAMGDLLAAADLVVCRAGATTLAELSVLGRPSVLVPYPYATDDHQTRNAEPFVAAGAAVSVADSDVDGAAFGTLVASLLADPSRRAIMAAAARALGRPSAAEAVAEVVRDAVSTRQRRHGGRGGL